MLVVATAFETEAKSKTVAMVTGGEAVSKVNRPNTFSAINFPRQERRSTLRNRCPQKKHAPVGRALQAKAKLER